MTTTTGGAADNTKVQLSRPRISSKEAKFATVLVGPDEDRFVVHEAALIHHSKFFRAALTGGFKEAQEKMIRLGDEEPEIFEFFVHWLYYQQLPSTKKNDDPELVAKWEEAPLDFRLVQMYIFAHTHCVERLERQALDTYFDVATKADRLFHPTVIDTVFSSLDSKTALCRLLVDMRCYYEEVDPELHDSEERWNNTFMYCVWQRYRTLTRGDGCYCFMMNYQLRLCDYHDHKTDAERKACKGASTETSD